MSFSSAMLMSGNVIPEIPQPPVLEGFTSLLGVYEQRIFDPRIETDEVGMSVSVFGIYKPSIVSADPLIDPASTTVTFSGDYTQGIFDPRTHIDQAKTSVTVTGTYLIP